MPHQFASLTVAMVLAMPGAAFAHRLEAEYHVLPDGKVRVESWFDLSGESARGARIQVYAADGTLRVAGRLDEKGVFTFPVEKSEPLRVVVSAGAGHRKELAIPVSELAASPPADAEPSPADRSPRVTFKDVLIGLTFILAAAAFLLSVRNGRRLRGLIKPPANVDKV